MKELIKALRYFQLILFILSASNTQAQWLGTGDIYYTGGNVGIGTSSPVGDGLTIVGGGTGQDFLTLDRPSIGKMRFNANGYNTRMTFNCANIDRFSIGYDYLKNGLAITRNVNFVSGTHDFFLGNSGNIGIGEETPDFPLQVRTPNEPLDPISYSFDLTRVNSDARGLSFGISTDNSYAVIGTHNADLKLGHTFGTGAGGQPTFYPDITIKHTDQGIGKVGIGTTRPDNDALLTVAGPINSREVKVTVDAGADFVFCETYELRTLEETERFITENSHLPEIESEKEMLKNGIKVGEMNIKLLQKIEELTLYLIDINKQVKQLKVENQELRNEISTLKN